MTNAFFILYYIILCFIIYKKGKKTRMLFVGCYIVMLIGVVMSVGNLGEMDGKPYPAKIIVHVAWVGGLFGALYHTLMLCKMCNSNDDTEVGASSYAEF